MHWSLSEFLSLLQTRSQCWGVIELGPMTGFRVRVNDSMFYAVLKGEVSISGVPGGRISLGTGDTAIVIANSTHAIRTTPDAPLQLVDFIQNDEYGDVPRRLALGQPPVARLLCSRLKVRWPGGVDPHRLPPAIKIDAADQVIRLDTLVSKARGNGAAALLTRAAALTMTEGLRAHPQCQSIFREANFHDPISRAVQMMELHLHQDWTVGTLAAKVGMARSTFAGRFLAEIGKPPMEVLTDLRMDRAAGLVTRTRLKLSEIGERVGYRSQSAFSRRFEKHFNMTPGKMRSQQQSGETCEYREHGLRHSGSYAELFDPRFRNGSAD